MSFDCGMMVADEGRLQNRIHNMALKRVELKALLM